LNGKKIIFKETLDNLVVEPTAFIKKFMLEMCNFIMAKPGEYPKH